MTVSSGKIGGRVGSSWPTRLLSGRSGEALIWTGIGLFLVLNVTLAALRLAYDSFDADELNQAHIAWLVASGKVLYRDFWDNHGPLFALANGFLIRLTHAPPGVELILWCRAGSALATSFMVVLTYRMARRLTLAPKIAATAAAILASLIFVQDKGTECRPDSWQNVFWFAGLCLLLADTQRRRLWRSILAGLLFGCAVLTNVKAGLGPFFVVLYFVCGRGLHRLDVREVVRELGALLAGGIIVYLGFLGYFAAHDAVADFHFFNIVVNLIFVAGDTATGRGWAILKFLATEQMPFMALTALGIALWVADLRKPAGDLARPAGWLVAFVAIGFGFGWTLNNYSQFYLMLLPAWAIVAAFGLFRIAAFLIAWRPAAGRYLAVIMVVASAAAMAVSAVGSTPLSESDALRFQKYFTASLVNGTERSEPIGVIWDICGGFMFNEPVQRYWAADPTVGAVVERYTGANPFGPDFIRELERRPVRFVTGRDGLMLKGLPQVTQKYLRDNYYYSNCLWTRRRAPVSGE